MNESSLRFLPAIPWVHSSSEFGSVWVWENRNFIVTITGGEQSCYYIITNKSQNAQEVRPFADGRTTTFQEAEELVRETIGKSYSPKLGYQEYAGYLGTTFRISTGQKIDLGEYTNKEVEVQVINSIGGTDSYFGVASVKNYEFLITKDDKVVIIPPAYIRKVIIPEGIVKKELPLVSYRTFNGTITQECNGQLGKLEGTVEHYRGQCPIHEKDLDPSIF